MALHLVPYNNAMRLGQGFNSYTQEICVDNAVVGITSREDSQMIIAGTALPILPGPDPKAGEPAAGGGAATNGNAITTVPKNTGILDTLDTVTMQYPSQIVTYTSKYVNKLSDVANSLNVSGSLSIKYGELSGGGSGSYVDSDTFQSADLNFLVMVKVVNQTINVKDQLDFYPLSSHKDGDVGFDEFVKIYGDSFISGFQEGGFFHAIVSMRSLNKAKLTDIKGAAHVALQFGVGSVEGDGQAASSKKTLNEESEVNITVNWAGGGQLKNSDQKWTIDSLMDAASRFPESVARCPQRTHAILTKYTSLRRFLEWCSQKPKLKMLDYEIAQLYTDDLMDVYLGYKAVWKDVHNLLEGLDEGRITLTQSTASAPEFVYWTDTLKQPKLVPFRPTFEGLDNAIRTVRYMMVIIVNEVEEIKANPDILKDTKRPTPFIRPQVFRTLLPKSQALALPLAPPRSGNTNNFPHGSLTFLGLTGSVAWAIQHFREHDAPPTVIRGFRHLDWQVQSQDGVAISHDVKKNKVQITLNVDRPLGLGTGIINENTISWVAIPFNSKDFATGTGQWNYDNDPRGKTEPVAFPFLLDDSPIVCSWLTGWRFHNAKTIEDANGWSIQVSTSTSNVSRSGFSLVTNQIGQIDNSNPELPLYVSTQWLAFPRNLLGVDAGVIEHSNGEDSLNLKLGRRSTKGTVTFRDGVFDRTPSVWAGLSGLSFQSVIQDPGHLVPRIRCDLTNITAKGFEWSISTWEPNGNLHKAKFTWFAFASDVDEQRFVIDPMTPLFVPGFNPRGDDDRPRHTDDRLDD